MKDELFDQGKAGCSSLSEGTKAFSIILLMPRLRILDHASENTSQPRSHLDTGRCSESKTAFQSKQTGAIPPSCCQRTSSLNVVRVDGRELCSMLPMTSLSYNHRGSC